MDRRCFLGAACLAGAMPPAHGARAEPAALEVVSHYDYPPFITGPGEGLSHDLLAWMRGELRLHAEFSLLPRPRLTRRVSENNWQGFVPWVNPVWFGDEAMQRFVWSAPVMNDEDLVLQRAGLALDYRGPASLHGLTVGGVLGHVYADIDPEVKAGRVRREDAVSTELSLRKLLRGRVDVVFLSRSGLPWWLQRLPELQQGVVVAPVPRQRFQRFLMLSPQMQAATRDAVFDGVAQMRSNPGWRRVLARYGLSPA